MSQVIAFGINTPVIPSNVPTQFTTDAGTAIPAANNLDVLGGVGINTAGAGDVLTINLDIPVSIANGGTNATSMTTTNGTIVYDGTRLVTTATGSAGQILTSNGAGSPPTYQAAPGGISTLTGNAGGPVGPTGGNIDIVGTDLIDVIGNPGTSTLTISINDEVATDYDTDAGTAVPAGGILAITGGPGINTAGATNVVTINVDQDVALFDNGNAGTASPVANALDVVGANGITITGASNSLSVALDVPVTIAHGGTNATSMTNTYGVNYFDGTRLVTTGVGTMDQVLTSNGAGVAPTFKSVEAVASSVIGTAVWSPTGSVGLYQRFYGSGSGGTAVGSAQFVMPDDITIFNLYVNVTTNNSSTPMTIAINVNGVDTALSVAIPATTNGVFSNTVNTVAVAGGDLVALHLTGNTHGGSGSVMQVTCALI